MFSRTSSESSSVLDISGSCFSDALSDEDVRAESSDGMSQSAQGLVLYMTTSMPRTGASTV